MRKLFVLIHRYAGLTMTLFLVIVGLTGSVLAFYTGHGHNSPPYIPSPSGRGLG